LLVSLRQQSEFLKLLEGEINGLSRRFYESLGFLGDEKLLPNLIFVAKVAKQKYL